MANGNGVSAGRFITGISGLDTVLQGGLPAERAYLVRGGPGVGKTTLGLQFLAYAPGESLLITLGESGDQLRAEAASVGLSLDGVTIVDLSPTGDDPAEGEPGGIFHPGETDREPLLDRIRENVEAAPPRRVFIDSLTQFRYLAPDAFQFRKQVLTLLRYLTGGGATVVFASEAAPEMPDDDLQFLADGVINLRRSGTRRELEIRKLRRSGFLEGAHTFRISSEGLTVYTRLVPDSHSREAPPETKRLGINALDELLGGGLESGTATMITGPTGVGKTTLGMQIISAAAARDESAAVYSFEEQLGTLTRRCDSIGLPIRDLMESRHLTVVPVEPLRHAPDEFAHMVRYDVESRGVRIVMLDSLRGLELSMPGGDLVPRLHALVRYLTNMNVTVLVVNEVDTVIGQQFQASERGVSYIADTIVFLRYLELEGEMQKAIGVLKKRTSDFERTLRRYSISQDGVSLGEPLTQLRGIVSGMPEWLSPSSDADGDAARARGGTA